MKNSLKAFSIVVAAGLLMGSQHKEEHVIWRLDNLEEIGGHKVTVVGSPKVIDTPGGKAIEFDGVNDGIFLDVHPLAGMTEFTVEVVFKPYPDGQPEQRFFMMQEAETTERVMFETRLTAEDQWFVDTFMQSKGNDYTMYAVGDTHELGPWYHAAIVMDGKNFKHYVNGKMELGKEVEFTPQKPGRTSLGVRMNKVYWYKGAIRTARFTPKAKPSEFLTAND